MLDPHLKIGAPNVELAIANARALQISDPGRWILRNMVSKTMAIALRLG
jgi:hypothetical protein